MIEKELRSPYEVLSDVLCRLKDKPSISEVYIKCCAMGKFFCADCGNYNSAVGFGEEIIHKENCAYQDLIEEIGYWIATLS